MERSPNFALFFTSPMKDMDFPPLPIPLWKTMSVGLKRRKRKSQEGESISVKKNKDKRQNKVIGPGAMLGTSISSLVPFTVTM